METIIDQDVFAETARSHCGVETTLRVLDGKWSTLIIRDLLAGPLRFGEIRRRLGNPSAKTVTERLRSLEHHGLLTRTAYAEIPPRVVYELTDRGRSLRVVLEAMLAWGDGPGADIARPRTFDD